MRAAQAGNLMETITTTPRVETTQANRWAIASAGIVMQLALGAIYAWSLFITPLVTLHPDWTRTQITLTFSIALVALGVGAITGGTLLDKHGPRKVATLAGILYGVGFIGAGLFRSLPGLYLTYGLIGGLGLGLGYIVPLATLIKWFPDRRGMITGLAVAGFGAGALVTGPVAQRLIVSAGLPSTFAMLGLAYLVAVSGAGLLMIDP